MKRFLLTLLFATSLFADEGMWMPQQIPALGEELTRLGLKIDPAQFADLTGFPMGAIVQIPGCTASFVSPEGLIATNHHCAAGALQFNSTKEKDYLRNGFLARERAEEITATPDARVWVTTNIEDVTSKILAAFPKNTSDRERARVIRKRRHEMTQACEAPGGVSCLVASFFEGAQYLKITRMEIRDVRLVYAPALGIGRFGGDVDNWMWPRHTGDFAFYRAYVGADGKPADFSATNVAFRPKHWLKISTRDLDPGDLILISGYPGTTHRHELAYEVEEAVNFGLPAAIRYRTMLRDVLKERSKIDREIAIRNTSRINSFENYLKKYTGTLEAFKRAGIVASKKKEEAGIRAMLDEKLAARYDVASAELHKILAARARTRERDTLFGWIYQASPMLTQANRLVRNASERSKSDADREDDFSERNRKRLEQQITRARRSIEPGSDRAGLRLMLIEAAKLPGDQRIAAIDQMLAATKKTTLEEQIEALLDQIYANTKIGNADAEKAMFAETAEQLAGRNDSMIAFASALRPFYEEREAADQSYEGAMSRLRPVMLEALRVARRGRLYPDANGTLRVNFGQVEGYSPRNGVVYTAQTDIRGVVEKESGQEPFDSPKKLLERAAKKEFGTYVDPEIGTLPVSFVSSNVVTNGNSGSASMNAYGELAGLSYDVNWEGVGGDYLVEHDITRSISVDSRYILWVMDAIDGAHHLMREMGVEPQF